MQKLMALAIALLILVGCGQRELSDCDQVVLDFEKELMAQDKKFNEAYQPFQKACARLSAQGVLETAEVAIRAAKECNSYVHSLHIPKDIPDKLHDLLAHAQTTAATSYFARGKSAENVLNSMTGKGEQYSTVETLLNESEQYAIQAALALSMAKVMVGLTQ